MKMINMEGRTFGLLTVVKQEGLFCLCKCSCGGTKKTRNSSLRHGGTRSCGCIRGRPITHGMCGTKEHKAWNNMRSRCKENHPDHSYYRDRGITVCKQWQNDFMAFYNHIGPAPSASHSVDRIKNNQGYKPGNVRWATKSQQNKNRRNS